MRQVEVYHIVFDVIQYNFISSIGLSNMPFPFTQYFTFPFIRDRFPHDPFFSFESYFPCIKFRVKWHIQKGKKKEIGSNFFHVTRKKWKIKQVLSCIKEKSRHLRGKIRKRGKMPRWGKTGNKVRNKQSVEKSCLKGR